MVTSIGGQVWWCLYAEKSVKLWGKLHNKCGMDYIFEGKSRKAIDEPNAS